MKIDFSGWNEFLIGDLFTISRGKTLSAFDKECYKGTIPCINGSSENNGVFCYLDESIIDLGFKLQKSPAISLSRVGNSGYTFYQPNDFFIADNAFALHLKDSQSPYVYQFLSTILNLETFKYSYGRTISTDKYKKILIKLPTTAQLTPDFNYMENYIKSLHYKPIKTRVKFKSSENIDTNEWKLFLLSDLFDISASNDKNLQNSEVGCVPYVASSSENNGVTSFIDAIPSQNANTLSIARNGSVGSTFYQEKPYCASPDDVRILKPLFKMNKYSALFIKTLIEKEKYKYAYGRKLGTARIKDLTIKLPICKDGNLDLTYMENVIKALPYSDRI